VGFRIDLDFGKTADLVAAFEPEANGNEIYKNVQQAYLSVQATDELTIDAGKFVTPIGAEVIESQDDWNYTRSVLFGYAIPFYHVGLRATLAASDKVSISGFLVNGWNNASVIYEGKPGLAIAASVAPSDKLTWVANFMSSLEVPDPDAPRRNIFDSTITLSPSPRLSVMANFDYGKEGAVKWWGLAGYAKYQATGTWALVGRYEYLDDTDGGFMTIGQKAQTFTVTSDHLVADALKVRLEYRLDKTKDDYFEKSDGTLTDSQSTLTVGVVYGFGGTI
jgi:Putative beta-barrel porin-2, OmpL-like. bbp2